MKSKGSVVRLFRNITRILRLQTRISKKPLCYVILTALAEKAKKIVEIILPAVIIDLLLGREDWNRAVMLIFMFASITAILEFLVRGIRDLLSAHAERVDNYVTMSIREKNLLVDYQDLLSAESRNKASKGLQAIEEFLEVDYILFVKIFGSLISLITLGYVVVQLDFFALVIVLAAALGHYFLEHRRMRWQHFYDEKMAELSRKKEYLDELFFDHSIGKDVRVYNGMPLIKKKFLYVADAEEVLSYEQQKQDNRIVSGGRMIACIQTMLVYGMAILKYMAGGITIGSFTIYMNAATEISACVCQILDSLAELVRVNLYFEDYDAYMQLPQNIQSMEVGVKEVRSFYDLKHDSEERWELCFENVSFCYPGSNQEVLRDISLKIRQGERISVVGDNGAGKTTLVYLILRLFDPTAGRITLNGVDIREYNYYDYRRLLAPVFQDYEVMSYSLRENVVFDNFVDEVRLKECYKAADLSEKIASMKAGDKTIMTKELDEDGEELSGGEKQKLSLARAYYHGGEILILDEPTAAIDPVSEYTIYRNISEHCKDRTVIFITHRLTSTIFSDLVLVLDKGKLVQTGAHTKLMAEEGLYAEMFEKQAYYYKN